MRIRSEATDWGVWLTAVAGCLSAAVAVAASDDRHVASAGELVELCTVAESDPDHGAARGFCYGYLDAALDYHGALTAGAAFKPIACPHPEVTRAEVLTVFVDWAEANPGDLDVAPVEGVMRAVSLEWQCPDQ